MPSNLRVLLTTVGRLREAKLLARTLISERRAACVQITPLYSVYRWKGKVTETPEYLLWVKVPSGRANEARAFLRQHHPYEVPEILEIATDAVDPRYLRWAQTSVQRKVPKSAPARRLPRPAVRRKQDTR